jgi:hypothetical protein
MAALTHTLASIKITTVRTELHPPGAPDTAPGKRQRRIQQRPRGFARRRLPRHILMTTERPGSTPSFVSPHVFRLTLFAGAVIVGNQRINREHQRTMTDTGGTQNEEVRRPITGYRQTGRAQVALASMHSAQPSPPTSTAPGQLVTEYKESESGKPCCLSPSLTASRAMSRSSQT